MSARWKLMPLCPGCLHGFDLNVSYGAQGHPVAIYPVHEAALGQQCSWSGHDAPEWDEPTTRQAVTGRSCGICEVCTQQAATEKHHRLGRGRGGGWYPSNILDLCSGCHRKATINPRWAEDRGISCPTDLVPVTPAKVARYDGTVLILTDDIAPPLMTPPSRQAQRRTYRKTARR